MNKTFYTTTDLAILTFFTTTITLAILTLFALTIHRAKNISSEQSIMPYQSKIQMWAKK